MDGRSDMQEGTPVPPADLPDILSAQSVRSFPFPLVLCDPRQDDCPIVYVNPNFTRTTGYEPAEVLGRNCRFMQGPESQPSAVAAIRRAVEEGRSCVVDILNYRRDGTPFPNRLMLSPLHNPEGELVYFLGVQSDLTDETAASGEAREMRERLRELQHRVKNHLAMILSMIRIETRRGASEVAGPRLTRRVEALATLYEAFSSTDDGAANRAPADELLGRIVASLSQIDDRAGIETTSEIAPILLPMSVADPLGLYLSEVLTNAYQHGLGGRSEGTVTVTLSAGGQTGLLSVTDDGPGMPAGAWPGEASVGSRIVRDLIARLDGELDLESGADGTRVSLRFPLRTAAGGTAAP